MILTAIYDFLTSTLPMSSAVRNNARRVLRHYVGNEIYTTYRPQNDVDHLIVLTHEGGEVLGALHDLPQRAYSEVSIDLYSVNRDRYEIALALKQLLHQYQGELNVDYSTQGILLDSEPLETPIEPLGAGGDWLFRTSFPVTVEHNQLLPSIPQTNFVRTADPDDDEPTDDGSVLLAVGQWAPDETAVVIGDSNAIGGQAWQVRTGEQIYAGAATNADTYSIFVRYRHSGVNPGDAKITVNGTEFDLTSSGGGATYNGASTVGGVSGWTFAGGLALPAANISLIIDGPTTPDDAVVIDRVALVP